MLSPRLLCRRRRPVWLRGRAQGRDVGGRSEAATLGIEGVADVVVAPGVREVAGDGDHLHLELGRVDHGFVGFAEPAFAGLVRFGWRELRERLVGPLMIIVVPPTLEAALLGGEIGRRRLDGLRLQVAVHTLVRAVVLR